MAVAAEPDKADEADKADEDDEDKDDGNDDEFILDDFTGVVQRAAATSAAAACI